MTFPFEDAPPSAAEEAMPVTEPAAETAAIEEPGAGDPQSDGGQPVPLLEAREPESPPPAAGEPPMFANVFVPEVRHPERIPHFGHLLLLLLLLVLAGIATSFVGSGVMLALRGINSTTPISPDDVRVTLGEEGLVYLFLLVGSYLVFPLVWHRSLFSGLQWNAMAVLRLRWRLIGTGFVCYVIAVVNILLIPGPQNTPIEKVFKQPGAAWLLFAFGVTVAPFFEEFFFRGFLLPALCTAYDWLAESIYHVPRRPLTADGHPQWSLSAMAIASVVTSVPFAMMHAHQTGDSVDAVLLLGCVSLVLCAVRLATRSLACSVFVHAFYNFLIFSMMLLGTQGFQHLDKT